MAAPADDLVRARVEISLSGVEFKTEVPIPRGPVSPRALLPVARGFVGAITEVSEGMARAHGRSISCRAGCGACCRQLVPIARSEAHHLRALVDALPEPRRTQVRDRFAAVVSRLRESGMLAALTEGKGRDAGQIDRLAHDYFRLGLACPFLESESCSIHPERPLACREYLVMSPPALCADTEQRKTERLALAAKVSAAFMELDEAPGGDGPEVPWLPLPLLLEWTETNAETAPVPGPKLLGRFLEQLRATAEYPPAKAG